MSSHRQLQAWVPSCSPPEGQAQATRTHFTVAPWVTPWACPLGGAAGGTGQSGAGLPP